MKNRSEASTFAGIPIPLTMECLLDATQKAYYTYMHHYHGASHEKNKRRYHAFRERILRMDAEKDEIVQRKSKSLKFHQQLVSEQDKRIAELEAMIDDIASPSMWIGQEYGG